MKKPLTTLFAPLAVLFMWSCSDNIESVVQQTSEEQMPVVSRSITEEFKCGTVESEPPAWFFTPTTRAINTGDVYTLNIFVHVVRSSSGSGLNKEYYSQKALEYLNSYPYGNIKFFLLGSDYIDSDNYNLYPGTYFNKICQTNAHDNAIDIYILSNVGSWDCAGQAEDIISSACVIDSHYFNHVTFPHEIGHCLGLYHTHHGTYSGEYGIPELVNGSNSAKAGDYIVDTPADPNEWKSGVYIGVKKDANGDSYNPDPTNIMSYSWVPNQNMFTARQQERMYDAITNEKVLNKTIHVWQITGPKHFNGSATYSLETEADWTVTAYTNGQSTKTTYNSTQSIELSAASSTYYEIVATVGSTSVVTYATSGAPSPYVGYIEWKATSGQYGTTNADDYGNTLLVSSDFTLNLSYTDKAGNTSGSLSNFNFQCVTTSRALHRGSTMTFTPSECKRNLMIRASDACGSSDGYFTIPCQVVNYAYNIDVSSDNLTIKMVEVNNAEVNKILAEKDGVSLASAYDTGRITSVTVSDENQKIVFSKEFTSGVENVCINKASWDAGTYLISFSNGQIVQNRKIVIP